MFIIGHADGSYSLYAHLKNCVEGYQEYTCIKKGEILGYVGSSGQSTGPHLHYELWDENCNYVDPFSGDCNNTTASSLWEEQPNYKKPQIADITTHGNIPSNLGWCYEERGDLHLLNSFKSNQDFYINIHYRDFDSSESLFTLFNPLGESVLKDKWSSIESETYGEEGVKTIQGRFGSNIYGRYTIEVKFKGKTYNHYLEHSPGETQIDLINLCQTLDICSTSNDNCYSQYIHFDSDQDVPTEDGKYRINEIAAGINENSECLNTIYIIGHTDTNNTSDYNDRLSENRANTVKHLLSNVMLSSNIKLRSQGKGESEPVYTNGVEDKAKSRRVVFCFE